MSHAPSDGSPTPAPARRGVDGRFLAGIDEPGNRFGRRVAALREALVQAVTPGDIREIAVMMIECAKMGSESAAKLVFQYAVGRPAPMTDPDRVDHDEWKLRMERPDTNELNMGIRHRPPLHVGVTFGRTFDVKDEIETMEATQKSLEDDVRKMGAESMPGDAKRGQGPSSHGRHSPRTAGNGQKTSTGGKA